MSDLLIKGGKVVDPFRVFEADLEVTNGKIVKIDKRIDEKAERVIDASGKLVCPGGIDPHVHMELLFQGTYSADDFEHGTKVAAFGGITTIIDFAYQKKGLTLHDSIQEWRKKADGKVCIDYAIHSVITDFNESTLKEIGPMVQKGIPSFKLYMPYRKEGLLMDDGGIFATLKEVRDHGGLVQVHCENVGIIEYYVAKFVREGKLSADYHLQTRPSFVEGEAVRRLVSLTEITGGNSYVVHMSSKMGREAIRDAQRKGLHVYGETCPHYLVLTDDVYKRADARNFVMSPPIKTREDQEALWTGLAEGDIKTMGSDHCPFTTGQKNMGKDDFTKIPNGVAGTEAIIPVVFSEGVGKGRLSLPQFVRVTSYNTARLFGLYPEKGMITVGADADLVVIDPKKKVRLTKDNLHSKIDYSIYEDVTVEGYPVVTISRGRVVCEDGNFTGKKGEGRYLPRKPYPSKHPEL